MIPKYPAEVVGFKVRPSRTRVISELRLRVLRPIEKLELKKKTSTGSYLVPKFIKCLNFNFYDCLGISYSEKLCSFSNIFKRFV